MYSFFLTLYSLHCLFAGAAAHRPQNDQQSKQQQDQRRRSPHHRSRAGSSRQHIEYFYVCNTRRHSRIQIKHVYTPSIWAEQATTGCAPALLCCCPSGLLALLEKLQYWLNVEWRIWNWLLYVLQYGDDRCDVLSNKADC